MPPFYSTNKYSYLTSVPARKETEIVRYKITSLFLAPL